MITRILFVLLALRMGAQSTGVPLGVRLTPPANVPATVNERFRQFFPAATPSWQRSGDSAWTAAFTDVSTGLPRQVLFDASGERIESRKQVTGDGYPRAIDAYFHAHRPTDKYLVWRRDQKDRPGVYFVATERDTTWFKTDGAYAYDLNGKRGGGASNSDAEIVNTLLDLVGERLALLRLAEKNGFGTRTRRQRAEQMDAAVRSVASSLNLPPDSGTDTTSLRDITHLHGDKLNRSVNRKLQHNAQSIERQLRRAESSGAPVLRELAEKFDGPEN